MSQHERATHRKPRMTLLIFCMAFAVLTAASCNKKEAKAVTNATNTTTPTVTPGTPTVGQPQ
jgi:hypothetical protein